MYYYLILKKIICFIFTRLRSLLLNIHSRILNLENRFDLISGNCWYSLYYILYRFNIFNDIIYTFHKKCKFS